MAPAGDSLSGSAGRHPPPRPAEPVCGLSASEDSVCVIFCEPASVCPPFTERTLFGASMKPFSLPPPPRLAACSRRLWEEVSWGLLNRACERPGSGAPAAPVLQTVQRARERAAQCL